VSGFVFEVFGDAVVWASRKQKSVSLSSTEAQFTALATAVSGQLWLKQLLKEMLIEVQSPVKVYEDNQSCIFSLSNRDRKRLKHVDVDIKYRFVRDLCGVKDIDVVCNRFFN